MLLLRGRRLTQRYVFVVVGLVFACLLVAAGLRGTPGVLMLPLEREFGWTRSQVSLSAAIGILLFGLTGPFAAAIMQRFGVRRTMLVALSLMATSAGASAFMREYWQLIATWGVLTGLGSGCITVVLGATIVNRWFLTHRGVAMGVLTAASAAGMLIFMPLLASLAELGGFRPVVLTVSAACLALIPFVAALFPERPSDVGLMPWGASAAEAPVAAAGNPLREALAALASATDHPDFWLLSASFFVCGATTNGLVGTHLLAMCGDFGIPETRAAALLATMGVFDLIGTTLSGWLTDRYDPRKLLFVYYGLRGLSLIWLPYSDFTLYSLSLFSVFYGLDWIATVPPTLRLTNAAFGDKRGPVIFGWIVAVHMLGAATATLTAGKLRTVQGNYTQAFVLAGSSALVAALLSLLAGRARRTPESAATVAVP